MFQFLGTSGFAPGPHGGLMSHRLLEFLTWKVGTHRLQRQHEISNLTAIAVNICDVSYLCFLLDAVCYCFLLVSIAV